MSGLKFEATRCRGSNARNGLTIRFALRWLLWGVSNEDKVTATFLTVGADGKFPCLKAALVAIFGIVTTLPLGCAIDLCPTGDGAARTQVVS